MRSHRHLFLIALCLACSGFLLTFGDASSAAVVQESTSNGTKIIDTFLLGLSNYYLFPFEYVNSTFSEGGHFEVGPFYELKDKGFHTAVIRYPRSTDRDSNAQKTGEIVYENTHHGMLFTLSWTVVDGFGFQHWATVPRKGKVIVDVEWSDAAANVAVFIVQIGSSN
eukprot:TRINITY_DN390_c0_g1_i1.p1 TRINITY_DN390_c0_g1~~TRINITY_DN390_c0_g1_i1.p1  ORF type:complete len:167 (-),score=20.34 TRINITY_DN390_c0_g1_i1:92-592(-)